MKFPLLNKLLRILGQGRYYPPALLLCGTLCLIAYVFDCRPANAIVLQGENQWIHDPSRIVKCNGKYFVYYTGDNIPMRYSTDMLTWKTGKSVFEKVPDWVRKAVPQAKSEFVWAPDVIFLNNEYRLYYSFSTFGSKVSVIGLVTNPTLDPESPNYKWTDAGLVVQSSTETPYNAIDPGLIIEEGGEMWLSFGSWSRAGIQLVRLDKTTGQPASRFYTLAARQSEGPEAPYIHYQNGYYYLFENEGFCCRGMNSTYRIMVGRSKSITGPYLDKTGKDLAQGGGTLFLDSEGIEIGPGHVGIISEGGIDRFTYHYYASLANGIPTLGLQTMVWNADGWPAPGMDLSPGRYAIISKASGLALGVRDRSYAEGAPIVQFAFHDNAFQGWNISPLGGGYVSIGSLATGKYIDLFECDARDGAKISQYPWFNNDCQRWRIEPTSDGAYRIVSKSGSTLTLPGALKTPRAVIEGHAWTESEGQKWYFQKLP
jgi:arabinan endo-1,5-alpha-L-arabinosidase